MKKTPAQILAEASAAGVQAHREKGDAQPADRFPPGLRAPRHPLLDKYAKWKGSNR